MLNWNRWVVVAVIAFGLLAPATGQKEEQREPNRPKVPGKLKLQVRDRKETKPVPSAPG
jgi:hypothetical protein